MQKTVEIKEQVPMQAFLRDTDDFGGVSQLMCPGCGDEYTHLEQPILRQSDDYTAWVGRGNYIIIPGTCENGCSFELCIGFHKGGNYLFAK